ncbi:hypothetical protein ACFUTY_38730 [Streptomyces sp. NPDC057362]|uniref:hypothetical protein n=1 Tax=Streptomyces sp. NPDC057362 TaxID=3346106 RepID=UPI003638B25E
MITARLDYLAAHGTDGIYRRIFLADGKGLSVKGQPGNAQFEEVYLVEGVDVPNSEAWEGEDQWELWLTSDGEDATGRLFYDVPVSAVRALIEEHGGEGAEQDPIG